MSFAEAALAKQVGRLERQLADAEFWRDAFDRALHDARRFLLFSDCQHAITAQRRIEETLNAYHNHLNASLSKEPNNA